MHKLVQQTLQLEVNYKFAEMPLKIVLKHIYMYSSPIIFQHYVQSREAESSKILKWQSLLSFELSLVLFQTFKTKLCLFSQEVGFY